MASWTTVLTNWAVGQKIKAAALNNLNTAILELQADGTPFGQNAMEQQQTATQSIPANAWTILTMPAASLYSLGTGLTPVANGITVATAGRYLVTALASFASNSTGFRGIACGPSSGLGSFQVFAAPANGVGTQVQFSQEMAFAAGQTISIYVYQSTAGALLTSTFNRLNVRQVA